VLTGGHYSIHQSFYEPVEMRNAALAWRQAPINDANEWGHNVVIDQR